MVREIVFDTETTGFDADKGDKLVEIGAVELINHIPTGVTFHKYINPQRDVPEEAYRVHGLSYEYLKQFPTFIEIADEWLDFVGDSILVAHNANFDMTFVNYELKTINRPTLENNKVIDTLDIAKRLFPGSRVNLDALCKRFGIDNSNRTKHGALLDAELLADVYLQLIGGQEPSFALNQQNKIKKDNISVLAVNRQFRESRNFKISDEELSSHIDFLQNKLKVDIW